LGQELVSESWVTVLLFAVRQYDWRPHFDLQRKV